MGTFNNKFEAYGNHMGTLNNKLEAYGNFQ